MPTGEGQSFPHRASEGLSSPSGLARPFTGLPGAPRTPVGPGTHTCVITRMPCQAQTHRPQLQWQTRSSPRRCGRM